MAREYSAQNEVLIGVAAIDPENQVCVKDVGKKIDVRLWWLPEDNNEFAPGKGARFPKSIGPNVALYILKGCQEELAANPKVAAEIAALLAQSEAKVV